MVWLECAGGDFGFDRDMANNGYLDTERCSRVCLDLIIDILEQ